MSGLPPINTDPKWATIAQEFDRFIEQCRARWQIEVETAQAGLESDFRAFAASANKAIARIYAPAPAPPLPPKKIFPPKDKEDIEDEMLLNIESLSPAPSPPPSPKAPVKVLTKRRVERSSSSSSSDDGNYSDASSSSNDSGVSEKKKSKPEPVQQQEEDVFIDDNEPEVYSAEIMDKDLVERTNKEIGKRGKRLRSKRKLWSPSDHDHQRESGSKGIDLLSEATTKGAVTTEQKRELSNFLAAIETRGYDYAIRGNLWFSRNFGNALEGIRNNLGAQGQNKQALVLFDQLIRNSVNENEVTPVVEAKRTGGPGHKLCCFCNKKKNCPRTLWAWDDGREALVAHPIAICCSVLAHALIAFFTQIYEYSSNRDELGSMSKCYLKLERLFADLQEAHAQKSDPDRRFRQQK